MKTKTLGLALLTAILLAGIVTAALTTFSVTTPAVLTKSDSTTTFTISQSDVATVDVTFLTSPITISDGTSTITVNPDDADFQVDTGVPHTVTLTRGAVPEDFNYGAYSTSLSVYANETGDDTNNVTTTVTVTYVHDFCEVGSVNDEDLEMEVDITNYGEGDDNEWLPLDEIEVEVELENDANFDINDAVFELGLIEQDTGKNVADDLTWISEDDEKNEVGDIDEDEDDKHAFRFKVDSDMGLDEEDYLLYIKVYADGDEDETCIDYSSDLDETYYEDISIERESDDDRLVVVDEVQISPSTALCDEQVTVTAEVYNIGEDSQEKVKVKLTNSDLDLDLYAVLDDLDEGDSETVEFTFEVPKDAEEETYSLGFRTLYEYDDDEDEDDDSAYYENSDLFTASLKVEGNCIGSGDLDAEITATLEDGDVRAGDEVVIEATIKNTGDEEATYTISVEDNELFSTVESIEPSTLTLDSGESKKVEITLKLDEDAEGEQLFDIKVFSGGEETTQAVSLTVPESWLKSLGFSALKEKAGDNWFIWAIVAINVILIVAIIIVAVKVTKA
jgi:hypothetical protein